MVVMVNIFNFLICFVFEEGILMIYILYMIMRLKVVDFIMVFGFSFLDLKLLKIIFMIESKIFGVLELRVMRVRLVMVLFYFWIFNFL